jgi:hypothetical protein
MRYETSSEITNAKPVMAIAGFQKRKRSRIEARRGIPRLCARGEFNSCYCTP